MIESILVFIGLVVADFLGFWALMEFMVTAHDFLDRHGIQDTTCRQVDKELGHPQKRPRWKSYDY